MLSIGLIVLLFKTIPAPWSIVPSILLSILPPATWFATRILEIDPTNNLLFVGSWCMGFRKGRKIVFKKFEITDQEARIKRTAFSLPDGKEIVTDREFRAVLTLETGESFHLVGHPIKERIEEKIQVLNKKLGLAAKKN